MKNCSCAGLSQEATEIEDLKTILSKVKAEQQALPPLIEELLSNLEYEEQRYEARHAALQDEEAVKHRKLEALRQAVVYYRDRLALTIETLGIGHLSFVMRCIDHRDESRPFIFAVQVTEDNVYKVVGCTPNVVSLPKLLANLNTGSIEFCDFVRAMRQEFKAIVQKEEMTSSS